MLLWRPVWFRVLAEMVRFPLVERLYQNHFCWRMSRMGISRLVRFLLSHGYAENRISNDTAEDGIIKTDLSKSL